MTQPTAATALRERPEADRPALEKLLTVLQVAELLGVSDRSIWTWSHKGLLRSVKLGRRVVYDPADVRRFVEAMKR